MKAYNVTDAPTKALESKGLVNVPIKLGPYIIPPGEMMEVPDRYRSEAVQRFPDAIALEALPLGYEGGAKPLPTTKSDPPEDEEEYE